MSSRESERSLLGNSLLLAFSAAYIVAAFLYLARAAETSGLPDTLNEEVVWSFVSRALWLNLGGVFVFVMIAGGMRRNGIAVSDRAVSLGLFLIVAAIVAFSAWLSGALT